ncbi:hypothetical protein UG55_10483 [Frankia sp. EI5c]|uniref:hypothetical protein n=1 Tax=Frankia sp. EI5c TaxID=683316 RepID=UPI0007C33335|nr:hypothetical protein [Frankia sp. EI5c]OAA22438.1 hypothetical protein UG55_10483 [Frankia sp. EI5c]
MGEDGVVADDEGRPDEGRPGPAAPVAAPAAGPGIMVPAVVAGGLAVLFLVLAFVAAEPSRHAHGLLVVLDLVAVVGVGAVWLRVIRLLSLATGRGRVE